MVKKSSDFNRKIDEIVFSIDLNYILASARRYNQNIKLIQGEYKDRIIWMTNGELLSHNYDTAYNQLKKFIKNNRDKIIKINTTNNGNYPLNRNTIIYVPIDLDLDNINKEFRKVINCDFQLLKKGSS